MFVSTRLLKVANSRRLGSLSYVSTLQWGQFLRIFLPTSLQSLELQSLVQPECPSLVFDLRFPGFVC